MTRGSPRTLGARGGGWVALQAVLFVAIVVAAALGSPWPQQIRLPLRVIGGASMAAGFALAAAASRHLGASLTPFPRPLARGTLREDGVYRLVRHPIYGGILLIASGASLWSSPWALAPTLLLGGLFDRKRRREEIWLAEAYPDYGGYRERVSHVFWPGVW
jgi:protein-S-isoprenylcysteine O-methyltransferase Ste14